MAQQRRMAGKTRRLYKRVLKCMKDQAEDTNRWMRIDTVVYYLNKEAERRGGDKVTDPQVRRVVNFLVQDGHVNKYGHGRQHFKAYTIRERLETQRAEQRRARAAEICAGLTQHGIEASSLRSGEHFVISIDDAERLLDMIRKQPRTAARYGFAPKPPTRNTDTDTDDDEEFSMLDIYLSGGIEAVVPKLTHRINSDGNPMPPGFRLCGGAIVLRYGPEIIAVENTRLDKRGDRLPMDAFKAIEVADRYLAAQGVSYWLDEVVPLFPNTFNTEG